MRQVVSALVLMILSLVLSSAVMAHTSSPIVVFREADFPAADSAAPSPSQLESLFPNARFASAQELPSALADSSTQLLVLPYGSAFPEQVWSPIFAYLQHGGNLIVLGGRPFTRSAYRNNSGWHVREYSVRFTRPLMIDQYQQTPGSQGLQFEANSELPVQVPAFQWKQAFSPVIRLSAIDLYKRGGSAGSLDARLDTFVWGTENGRKLSAPLIQIDHLRNGFDGGRWIFLNAELAPDFFASPNGAQLLRTLTDRALQGSEEFTVRPVMPLYLPDEPIQLNVTWNSAKHSSQPLTVKVTTYPEDEPSQRATTTAQPPFTQPLQLAAPNGKGLYIIEAQLLEGDKVRAIYHSGFWIRDEQFLRSGPKLTVNKDYFELDGRPIAVVGTTYMSSEVQRLYFQHPNVYVWNRDLAQIHGAGLNMIRTGWWTGWDKFCDENGVPYESTLRTMEAYLMTARKYGLPVQFNLFAFLPDVLGGENAYLDPEAVRRQTTLLSVLAARFHDVPYLAWDLINEPSISQHLWTTRPNGDPFELAKWNEWLNRRYLDKAALAAAWNVPAASLQGTIPLPDEIEFAARGMYTGHNSLKLYDYYLFTQDEFNGWARTMIAAIRGTGSRQLITVGQDEGGIQDRLSPASWGGLVDFTTNHSWWLNDYILWDSLMAKQPGKALLIQETGLQRELNLDEVARRTPESEAALLERKIATSFIQGAGAIEWLWNSNSYMTESNETPIGAVRPDETEKPEATVLRQFAAFAHPLRDHLRNPQLPSIAIITSQAAQYSVNAPFQLEAQQKAVRTLVYGSRLPAYVIAENRLSELGSPKLAILPSPQALEQKSWLTLLDYVKQGGNLLITGPVERDEHWQLVPRCSQLNVNAANEPLTYHTATLKLDNRNVPLSFGYQAQNWLESLRFSDGSTFKEVPLGKGRIFWSAYPVELAEGTDSATALYSYVAAKLGLVPQFELSSPLSSGVLVYPTVLGESVLYVFVSDDAANTRIDLRDKATGVRLNFELPSQHAAMALLDSKEKRVLAQYGF